MNAPASPRASLAAQVAAQNRPVSITPIRPAVQSPSDAPITLRDLAERFTSLAKQQARTVGEMIFVAYRLWLANDWPALGFEDVEGFCEAAGVSVRYWDQLTVLGERLQHLTLGEVQNLSFPILQSLGKVHPSIWSEYAWVEEAKALTAKEFQMIVAQRNSQVTKTLVEPRCALTLRVPLSQQPVLERRLEALRRQERFSSTAEALTFALESVDRADLLADTVAEIQGQVSELKRLYESESPEEKDARLDGKIGVGVKAQSLFRRIDKTIGGAADALPAEEVSSADSGASVSTVR